jgi:NAD(P)-dependent dehydrogenase (short-subunit alcohol dehydrogenase family)
MSPSGKREVVVVTGASAGVGRATVCAFAKQGALIGLLARGRAGLEGAQRDVEALGGEALAVPTDVADPEQVERAAAAVEARFGPIDVWVNDAFCSVFSPVRAMTPADYRRVTEVTYLGFVHGTLAALKRMLPRDRGIIVQVGSALAYRGIPLQSAYCAAKHAIQGFTESVRCELIHDRSNVKITMVQMPALNTPQFTWSKSRMPRKAQPVPPIYQPEVAGDAIVWAAHHYRREWYVGGSTAVVITGNKIAPGFGDWYLAQQGYGAQQHDGADDPNRPNNLYAPVDAERDFGAHGEFDDRAHPHSYQLWADQRRDWIALAGAVGAAWDAVRHGPSKCWRGGLIGLSLGLLGALGAAALAHRADARRVPGPARPGKPATEQAAAERPRQPLEPASSR